MLKKKKKKKELLDLWGYEANIKCVFNTSDLAAADHFLMVLFVGCQVFVLSLCVLVVWLCVVFFFHCCFLVLVRSVFMYQAQLAVTRMSIHTCSPCQWKIQQLEYHLWVNNMPNISHIRPQSESLTYFNCIFHPLAIHCSKINLMQ